MIKRIVLSIAILLFSLSTLAETYTCTLAFDEKVVITHESKNKVKVVTSDFEKTCDVLSKGNQVLSVLCTEKDNGDTVQINYLISLTEKNKSYYKLNVVLTDGTTISRVKDKMLCQ